MTCTCLGGCRNCEQDHVKREVFHCPGSQQINRHQHIVRHQHDIINEYDVIHEHEYNTRDVVREREVVRHNDFTCHEPNYCGNECNSHSPRPMRPQMRWGRRW